MEIELMTTGNSDKKNNHYGVRKGNILDEVVAPEIWSDDYVSIVSKENDVWDNEVKCYVKKCEHHMYFSCEIGAPDLYDKSCYFLREVVDEDAIIYIYINNGGGNIDSAMMLRDAIIGCRGKTVARLSGIVASSATLLVLACDELECGQSVSWLSHNYSSNLGGGSLKGAELKAQTEFMNRELNRMFKVVHIGFFTEEEMENIINDKDYWLNADEVMKRWCKYKCLRDSCNCSDNDGDKEGNSND